MKKSRKETSASYSNISPNNVSTESVYSGLLKGDKMGTNVFHIISNYEETLAELLKRKARLLADPGRHSSYEQWSKAQDLLAQKRVQSNSREAIVRERMKITQEQFLSTLSWETIDIINYLVSDNFLKIDSSAENQTVLLAQIKSGDDQKEEETNSKRVPNTGTGKTKNVGSKKSNRRRLRRETSSDTRLDGHLTYNLADVKFINSGWTRLPSYGITSKIISLGTNLAYHQFHAFRHRTSVVKYYDETKTIKAAEFNEDFPHYVYYPNKEVAIQIRKGSIGYKLTVYSMSQWNRQGEWVPSTIQAVFDEMGNGVIYDLNGNIRLNYDQMEGAIYREESRPIHWYWRHSTFVRQRRVDFDHYIEDPNDDIESEGGSGSVEIKGSRSSLRSISPKTAASRASKQKSGSSSRRVSTAHSTHPKRKSQLKRRIDRVVPPLRSQAPRSIVELAPIAMMISNYTSIRIASQQHIHIDFECGALHFRFYVGVDIKFDEIHRIDKVVDPKRVRNIVPCYFELMPNRSQSCVALNKIVRAMRLQAEVKRKIQARKRARALGYHFWFKKRRDIPAPLPAPPHKPSRSSTGKRQTQ